MRLRSICLLLLGGLLLGLTPSPHVRAADLWSVTAADGLHLRACPSTDCAIDWTMPYGEQVSADGSWSGAWLEVNDGGTLGWADADWLVQGQVAAPVAVQSSGGGTCFPNTWGDVVCAPDWIANEVASAAAYYGQSYDAMMEVAACESNFDSGQVTGDAVGLFQFLPGTFYSYSNGDIWSVSDQAWTTAYMWSLGEAGQWDCYARI